MDARDNTGTNTNTDGAGVPIYWLNGNKAADDNADFYDGDWDDEANDKDESGADGPDTSLPSNRPFTGCNHNGTEALFSSASRALGASSVRIGRPNHSGDDNGPLSSGGDANNDFPRPMYGLSQVFEVLASTTLVSNTHLSATDSKSSFIAQSFETGANLGGYTVSEVDISLGDVHSRGTSTRIRIREDNGGEPGALVANLTNPASLTTDSLNTFTVPAGTTLAASTIYWITTNEEISPVDISFFALTGSDDETSETGWSIGDGRLWRTVEADSWTPAGTSLLIAIKGTAIPPTTLVSNTHLIPTGHKVQYEAQSFETGANTGGYTISAVDIWLRSLNPGSNTSVKIRENNDSNQPGALVATLANPTSLTADSLNTFLAQDTITLDPRTTYWISVNEGFSTSFTAVFGSSTGNAETGEPGWSIGDTRLSRADETHSWYTDNSTLLMTIKGTAVPCDGIWCATLTVQDLGSFDKGCDNTHDSTKHCSVLLDPSNTFSHAGVNYTIEKVRDQNGSGNLEIWVAPDIATGSENLVLHVGSDTYRLQGC